MRQYSPTIRELNGDSLERRFGAKPLPRTLNSGGSSKANQLRLELADCATHELIKQGHRERDTSM